MGFRKRTLPFNVRCFDTSQESSVGSGSRKRIALSAFGAVAILGGAASLVLWTVPAEVFNHMPQIPYGPPDPDNPYHDIYGRPILYPLKPSGVSEYDTTMTGEDGSNVPPKQSPDALALRKSDPYAYYQTYYSHLTRGQLAQEDNALYKQLVRLEKKLGYELMPRLNPYGAEPLTRYEHIYKGLTRGQLYKADAAYYNYLRYHDLLGPIPLDVPAHGGNPKEFYLNLYNEKYAGLSRGKLEEVDPALYAQMTR